MGGLIPLQSHLVFWVRFTSACRFVPPFYPILLQVAVTEKCTLRKRNFRLQSRIASRYNPNYLGSFQCVTNAWSWWHLPDLLSLPDSPRPILQLKSPRQFANHRICFEKHHHVPKRSCISFAQIQGQSLSARANTQSFLEVCPYLQSSQSQQGQSTGNTLY